MSKISDEKVKDTMVSSTRLLRKSAEYFTQPLENQHFEVRSSHRRSTETKELIPKLSIARSHSQASNVIHFQVEKDVKTGMTAKQTLSKKFLADGRVFLQDVSKILALRSSAIFSVENLLSNTNLQSLPDHPVRFSGELMQHGSSRLTDIEIVTHDLVSAANSRASQFGDSSLVNIDNLWPWPWLSPSLNSSEYVGTLTAPKTFSLQEKLKFYPLMPLSDTLQTYIRSVRLFLSPKHLIHLEKLVNEFAESSGQDLQECLIKEHSPLNLKDHAKCCLPYLVPSLTKCLTRLEAPLSNSAILTLSMWDLWPERENSQIERATILIQLCTEFARLIYSERLNVFTDSSGYPQCNHQFRKLFSSCKIPGIPCDGTHCFFKTVFEPSRHLTPKHIVVICRGQMFSVDVILDQFRTAPTPELRMSLIKIMQTAEENAQTAVSGLGILSSSDRDKWSETRVHLMEISENNRQCLQKLEEAMFVLTLDHMKCRGPDRLINEALFADGCNRWYDKALSFYMYQNGLFTVNVCSSFVDNSIVNSLLRFIHIRILEDTEKWDDDVLKKSEFASRCVSREFLSSSENLSDISEMLLDQKSSSEANTPSTSQSETTQLRALMFDVDDEISRSISDAEISFAQLSEDLSSSMCQFHGFEMKFLEDHKISVDAFAHLALQLTFYKMYYRHPAVGSKVSMRRFHHARYDTLITTTEESIAWCRAMLEEETSSANKKKFFFSALDKHVQRLEEVRSGLGCFNHLSALHEIALRNGDHISEAALDDLFELPAGSPESLDISSEGYDIQESLSVAVVAPPSSSSYGVGYVLAKSFALFSVCSWKSYSGTCAENFSRSLHLCLVELHKFVHRL